MYIYVLKNVLFHQAWFTAKFGDPNADPMQASFPCDGKTWRNLF